MTDTPPKPFTDQFVFERLLDATKLVGGGNSAGVFGIGVAIYYFRDEGDLVTGLLRIAFLLYFLGFLFFIVAIAYLNRFVMRFDAVLGKHVPATETEAVQKTRAFAFTLAGLLLWLLASLPVVTAIFLL